MNPLSLENEIIKKYGNNPIRLFTDWMAEAGKSEINDPNAMSLATIDTDGKPDVRIVLLKDVDDRGFVFHTNFESTKGRALEQTPYATLNFHWKTLERQIRISGRVEKISVQDADSYFASRPRESQIGSWASDQSRPMDSYEELETRMNEMRKKFESTDNIPRPPHWGGFRVIPERIEFWIAHPYRLHQRFAYIKNKNGEWSTTWLYP